MEDATTFGVIANVPSQVTFGPASRCRDCGTSVASRTVFGIMRNEFCDIGGIMHRRFDAAVKICTCPAANTSIWLPDDTWPGSRETIRAALREYYLGKAYDWEQRGDLVLAECYRDTARIYITCPDFSLLMEYAVHLPRLTGATP